MATQTPEKKTGYLTEVRKEMRKVSWPTRQQVISNTVLTLVSSLALALFTFGFDQVISRVLKVIYALGG
ncbi:MAG: preprotein translocase subunit SecE [Bacteroidota bacterium]